MIDGHAIYLLNLLLAFLQPKFDPSIQDDLLADEIEEGGIPMTSPLPNQRDDEFRPFVRRLPEWQFWYVLFSYSVVKSRSNSLFLQAFLDSRNCRGPSMHVFRNVRCACLLADSACLLFHTLCSHYETSNTVRFH